MPNGSRFLCIAGRPDLADPGWATLAGRQTHLDEIWTTIAGLLLARGNAERLKALGEADIASASVQDLEDLLDAPHLAATGFREMHEHPREGTLRMPARLGEHTAELLAEFGVGRSRCHLPAAHKHEILVSIASLWSV